MTDDLRRQDRADVRQLSEWLANELARGATQIELHLPRSKTKIAGWNALTSDLTQLARSIVETGRRELEQAPLVRMISSCADEPPRVIEVANTARTVLVVAYLPTGAATLQLDIHDAEAMPELEPNPAAVLRETLRRLTTFAKLRVSPGTSVCSWLLLERLVGILSDDMRIVRLVEHLGTDEVESLIELLAGAR